MTEVISKGSNLSTPDYNHASDSQYEQYRRLADLAYGKRSSLSQKSQAAYKSRDARKAKLLSEQAKQMAAEGDRYNAMAAEYVFLENNRDSDENDIDLHGLYVREAEYILKQRIINGLSRQQSSLDCIVGKGLHSKNGIAKLRPAVEQLCDEASLKWKIDSRNSGILIIFLEGARIPGSWSNISLNGIGAMVENQNILDRRKGKQGKQGQQYQQQPYQQQQYQQQSYQQQSYQQQPYQQQEQQQQMPWQKIISAVIKILGSCFK
ncbi:hypothetical protein FOA43_002625 [Brettanomyces nanus]|uniref:Smr domain-containing protein n=1 Tax=Eeniella nana TaxID=13502 RepID=A0A875S808_EENNA|nr:uncharacterized protein FOA43_002625 [Brettanomyces nanus]QPG75274.1 hypothetical protein FOA43_002625 [Brettanomyces nanus]